MPEVESTMPGLNERAAEITDAENRTLWERTPGSKRLFDRAVRTMPAGVPSSFQAWEPYPVYLRDGQGSQVWDVDGNEYRDFHNGFGSMVVGHSHPKVVEAIDRAARAGTHFAAPTESTVQFAEELCRRFQLQRARCATPGTEATMSPIRLARAATSRDDIV